MAIDVSLDEVMNHVPEPAAPDERAPVPGSLQDRVRRRREALEANTTITLDVPGYEGVVAVTYKLLSHSTRRKISARVARETEDEGQAEILASADNLINACVELVEVGEDGSRRPLGLRWGARAAVEVFGRSEIEAGETARQGFFASFPSDDRRDELVLTHFNEWYAWYTATNPGTAEVLEGESEASSAGA